MPNIITHGLFAKAVYNEIEDVSIKNIIQEFPREFVIGSNGPDFLFFYKFFQKKYENIRNLGGIIHSTHTNDFYELAFSQIEKQEDETLKKAMISYLIGHLCHWALDSRSHPYIFYKTGDCTGISASMHHRFESMLDAMMLKRIKNETIKTYKFYLLAKQSPYSIRAISNIYIPILENVYHENISEKQIQDSLDDWYKIQTYLYDPKGIKTKILKLYEKKVHHPYLFSGNVVPYEIDGTYDILNEQKKTWYYPTDNTKYSDESFIEIFERAKNDVLDIIHHFNDKAYILYKLDNASYDTQEREIKEMKYFDLIYGDMDENI